MFIDDLNQFTENVREALDADARRRARLLRAWRKVRADRARLRADHLAAAERAARLGIEEGVARYAWWRDGVQYVGSGFWTLAQALSNARDDPEGIAAIVRRAVED